MIFVDGLLFSTDSSQERDALVALLELPKLVSASNLFKVMQEVKFSAPKESPLQHRWVYLFQREFATVDPALIDVHLIGGFEDVLPKVWSKNLFVVIDILEI